MPNFKIIQNTSEIKLGKEWVPATKFKSKDKLVDVAGRQYRIIEKRERTFSGLERFGRGFLGAIAVICTLFLALLSKSIKNLLIKTKETKRYAILEPAIAPVAAPTVPATPVTKIVTPHPDDTKCRTNCFKELAYINPLILFGKADTEYPHRNFAVIKTGGEPKLVAVEETVFTGEHKIYEGSALELLLKIAQREQPVSPIAQVLKHPNNSIITHEEFFKFILEQDRINTLNPESTLDVLNLMKEKHFPVKLRALFNFWENKWERNADITKAILEVDPTADETDFKVNDQGKLVYIKPELLFGGAEISWNQQVNFALVKTDGVRKLVPVVGAEYGDEHAPYEGSALEALLLIAQHGEFKGHINGNRHYGAPFALLLNHPNNSLITKDELFKYIVPEICTLNSQSTLEALTLIKDIPTESIGALFTQWAGKWNGGITKALLELDPCVIDQVQGFKNSPFIKAVLQRNEEEAELLLNAMSNRGINPSHEEKWIVRAFKNICAFSDEKFTKLDEDLKIKIYFVANAYGHEKLVKKLKPLGMETVPVFGQFPNFLASNMDIITARTAMDAYLKGLRKDGQLLTAEEFSKFDKNDYISKNNDIGRILGRNFIEKLAKENGLKHIKVPEKIAVIKEGLETVSFHVNSRLELKPKEDHVTVYAKRIERVKRNLSLEEAIELMIILEKTGYGDFCGDNIFVAADGIYFIDTEQKDFSPTRPPMESIKDSVDPNDVEKFLEAYEKRKADYDKEQESRIAKAKEYRDDSDDYYSDLASGYTSLEFTFPIANLV